MTRKRSIRKVRFGIRFKFSVMIIVAVTFSTALIGFAVFNQHENKIKETIFRLSGVILKGVADSSATYLRYRNTLYSPQAKFFTDRQKTFYKDGIKDAEEKMSEYFSSIVKKEKILDIAFIIDVNWTDTSIDWNRWDQARYKYFKRRSGRLFELEKYNKYGKVIKHRRGRSDAHLKPTIFSYYMTNIDVKPYLAFADVKKDDGKQFVIVGMPVFKNRKNMELYNKYLDFQKSPMNTLEAIKEHNKQKKEFYELFIKRLVNNNVDLEYELTIDTPKKLELIKNFILYQYDFYALDREPKSSGLTGLIKKVISNKKKPKIAHKVKQQVSDNLDKYFEKNVVEEKISFDKISYIFRRLWKAYRLELRNEKNQHNTWKNFYYYLNRYKIVTDFKMDLKEAAISSFRSDLTGIVGMFLLRHEFFAELDDSRNEILNLMISILLRAIVIALFLPTFLIRQISKLEEGALEIGKGHLDKHIELGGSDELGRLADLFNIMTGNLQKAQVQMLEKQRMQEELKRAQEIQETLLPEKLPEIKGIEFGAFYNAQTEAGGDYYDFIELDDKSIGVTIADVSGHGVGSGLVMAMTRTLLHTFCRKTTKTKIILEDINQYLYENTASNYFVTMFYGILNYSKMKLSYSSAGHNHGIVLSKDDLKQLPAGGIALGATSNEMMKKLSNVHDVTLKPGDYFIQFTDGVDEAMDANNNEFGYDRFHKVLKENYGKSPQAMIDAVVKNIKLFTGDTPQHDDITIIALRLK